jgi:AAA domain
MKDTNSKPFVTVATLSKTKFPESDWIVEGLLRTGLRRPALLAAKPETGKSTLARQLAVAVSQGGLFLGRTTTRSAVIYWQTEDDVQDVSSAFTRLGSKEGDANIHVFLGDPDASGYECIAALLDEDKNIKLVIIETLDDLLKIDDIKENTAARQAFDKFATQLMIPFSHRASFLALHHLKKGETNFAGDALLGASTIRGRTDAKIYLAQVNPDDETRIIWSTKRRGRAIPKMYLVFDPTTGKSKLGETIADAARNARKAEQEADLKHLFDILGQHPDIEHRALLENLSGMKQARKLNLIGDEVQKGSIIKSGKGVRGSPFSYRMASVRREDTGLICEKSHLIFEDKGVPNVWHQ